VWQKPTLSTEEDSSRKTQTLLIPLYYRPFWKGSIMAKEPVDFVFKANTSDIDKAFKKIADEFDKFGKGTKIKLDGIDTKSIIDAAKTAQAAFTKLRENTHFGEIQTTIQTVVDSLKTLESSVSNLDLSKPLHEILPFVQDVAKEIQTVVDVANSLNGTTLSVAFPTNEITGFSEMMREVTSELVTLTAEFKSFTDRLNQAIVAAKTASSAVSSPTTTSASLAPPTAPSRHSKKQKVIFARRILYCLTMNSSMRRWSIMHRRQKR
jgi:methyl-accepting chemotaxis protein